MTALRYDNPAHERIRQANTREGGRHRRNVATDSETLALCDLSAPSYSPMCPGCNPRLYAATFADHRAWWWVG